jgi:hypothetical protein
VYILNSKPKSSDEVPMVLIKHYATKAYGGAGIYIRVFLEVNLITSKNTRMYNPIGMEHTILTVELHAESMLRTERSR